MFRRRPPILVAFDVLVARGEDVRTLPLARRKAVLKCLACSTRRWIALTDGVLGQGRRLFELVGEMDLRVSSPSALPIPTRREAPPGSRILNRSYSQKQGSARDL